MGQHKAAHQHEGQTSPGQTDHGQANPSQAADTEHPRPGAARLTAKKNEAVLGPFTVRDVTVFASTLILFVASLIPMIAVRYNLWNLGSLFFLGLGILLPLIVAALFVARRLTPESKVRIGSLSVDQFASVVASFALAFFFLAVAGDYVPSLLVALIGSLGLFAATVLAPFIPFFAGDFLDRAETPGPHCGPGIRGPLPQAQCPEDPQGPRESAEGRLSGLRKRLTTAGPAAAGDPAAAGGTVSHGGAAGPAAASGRPRVRARPRRSSRPAARRPLQTPASRSEVQPGGGSTGSGGTRRMQAQRPSAIRPPHLCRPHPASTGAPNSARRRRADAGQTQAAAVAPSAAEQTRAAEVPAPSKAEQQAAATAPAAEASPPLPLAAPRLPLRRLRIGIGSDHAPPAGEVAGAHRRHR